MSDPSKQYAKAPMLTREEEAKLALEHTVISRGTGRFLIAVFLLTILSIPVWQHVAEIVEIRAGKADRSLPQMYDVFNMLPASEKIASVRGVMDTVRLLPTVQQIKDYESALEDSSRLAALVLPRMQSLLTSKLGAGNEQAYCGRDGWLFYRPDVDYATSRGFLDPGLQRQRARSGDSSYEAMQPDPVKAIIRLHEQLRARGIALVAMPTPMKSMIHPEMLSRQNGCSTWVQNPSFDAFCEVLRERGVDVFDPTSILLKAKESGGPQYLDTDTHWTPQAMDLTAARLADYLQKRSHLPEIAPVGYTRRPARVENLGDIAVMLKLPAEQTLYRPQRVAIRQVLNPDGSPWQPSPTADLLILGDSYTNIYSMAELGWGSGAGFAEQLSYHLRRPVNRIAINAGGAFASRVELANRLTRHYAAARTGTAPGREILADVKVVVYQFAMRELAAGDWKLIDLPDADPSAFGSVTVKVAADTDSHPPGGVAVTGRIAAITRPPAPASVTYTEAVIGVHLVDVKPADAEAEIDDAIIVYCFGMRKHKWTEAAKWNVGKRVTLSLVPWETMPESYHSYTRIDFTDIDLLMLPCYWGQAEAQQKR